MKFNFKKIGVILAIILVIVVLGFLLILNLRWERDVVFNNIEFKKLRVEGGEIIGFAKNQEIINGYVCQPGWVHLFENGNLKSCLTVEEFEFNSDTIPVGTWLILEENSVLRVITLPYDMNIQGHFVHGTGMGSMGVHTSFYESRNLKSFFSKKDVEFDNITCRGGLYSPITLHEDGSLAECVTDKDIEVDGILYKKGRQVNFYNKSNFDHNNLNYVETELEAYLLTQKDFAWQTLENENRENFCATFNLSLEDIYPRYVWAFCGEYAYENGKIIHGSGISVPVKIMKEGENYLHLIPRDGSLYAEDLENEFPETVTQKIFDHQDEIVKLLSFTLEDRVVNYFGDLDAELPDSMKQSCAKDSDCMLPFRHAIRSNCPYESVCVAGRCEVVCPEI